MVAERYLETPSADAAYFYQNNLVALDTDKGINNGEPFLHAGWIGAVAPQPGRRWHWRVALVLQYEAHLERSTRPFSDFRYISG